MTDEERSLLERTHKLAQENNDILRKIRRSNRIGVAFRIGYWIVILVLSFGALYFIQPYIDTLMDTYKQVSNGSFFGFGGE